MALLEMDLNTLRTRANDLEAQRLITEFSSTLEEYISMIRKAADETEQVDRELLAAVNRI